MSPKTRPDVLGVEKSLNLPEIESLHSGPQLVQYKYMLKLYKRWLNCRRSLDQGSTMKDRLQFNHLYILYH
jgi:hypothetical protein